MYAAELYGFAGNYNYNGPLKLDFFLKCPIIETFTLIITL